MKIELRKFVYAPSLSEETIAYTADIYIDGVKSFSAKNNGHGGCDMYHPYIAGLREPDDLEDKVLDLVCMKLAERELKRLMKGKTVMVSKTTDEIYTAKNLNYEVVARAHPDCDVVNNNPVATARVLEILKG